MAGDLSEMTERNEGMAKYRNRLEPAAIVQGDIVSSEELARSITRASSKQAFYTAQLLVDSHLVGDFCRAYAYFRWADDVVDQTARSDGQRLSFIKRQRKLIEALHARQRPADLSAEEEMLADLVHNHKNGKAGLRSFIENMFAVIEFDARRKGSTVRREQLDSYSGWLARSVTDGLQYFIGNEAAYPDGESRYLAAHGAHIVHLLRDTVRDIDNGYINIHQEYLDEHGIAPGDIDSPPFRAWVQERTELARRQFREGKRYLESLEVLRCKIAGYWYCARFESILDTIEGDGYALRAEYKSEWVWPRMLWLSIAIAIRHAYRRAHVFRARQPRTRQ